ncbi:prepilin-type N-terminal cleavage/methylation domain-containing protein [Sutterella sp.]|uniref:prepilin-type N-terminal cleavage/methylation domain-containing protein n=1 Tax=Sutterella sp. TaxID=1981025 RepID=UPI003FD8E009
MFNLRKQKGFTLIEIVLVLVLLGILSAVAIPKYYDLEAKAETAKVYALAFQFESEFNSETAALMLEGMSCQDAKYKAADTVGSRYTWNDPNVPGTISVDPSVIYTDSPEMKVFVRANSTEGRTYVVPSGVIICNNQSATTH